MLGLPLVVLQLPERAQVDSFAGDLLADLPQQRGLQGGVLGLDTAADENLVRGDAPTRTWYGGMPGRMRLMTSMVPVAVSRMARTRSFMGFSLVVIMVQWGIQPPSMLNDYAVMNDALGAGEENDGCGATVNVVGSRGGWRSGRRG